MRGPLFAIGTLALACGGSPAPPPPRKSDNDTTKEDAEIEARRLKREAKERAETEAAAAYQAKLDELATLPQTVPNKLEPACKAMLTAYDQYMQKVLSGDMLTKWKTGGNEMQLAVFRKECLKRTPPVAACQAEALSRMEPDMKDNLADVMGKCSEKFGAGPGSTVP